MKNIAFGQYYPADSVIHRLDPRAKVIMMILYIVCSMVCKNIIAFALHSPHSFYHAFYRGSQCLLDGGGIASL